MHQFKNLIFYFLILIIYKLSKINCNHIRSDDIFQYPFLNNYLNYEKGLIFKSIKNLQDSVAQVNSNLFYNVFRNNNQFLNDNQINKRRTDLSNPNKPLSDYLTSTSNLKPIKDYKFFTNYYKQLSDYKPISDYYKPIADYYKSDYKNILTNYKPLFKRNDKQLHLIQQLNKEIVRNQLVAYEKFLNKLKRYDTSDQVESRQAVNIIKTLFRFPILLLFSNIFNLPLLPTLVLASPFLNDGSSNNALSSLTTTLSNAASNAASNSAAGASSASSSATSNLFNSAVNLQTSASNQISSHLPFSLNPLVPINQLLNNFIGELIGELQNTPVFNSFLQSVNQVFIKPNRVSPLQNQQLNSQNVAQNITKKLINEQIAALNSTADDLINANASSINLVYQEPPPSTPLAYDKPLIGPVPDANPSGNILNTLASSLLETNKNYQLTEQLGVNNGGQSNSISELAMNAVNTLATMLKIKKQKKDLNSNEEMILDMLTSKNYLQEVTSIGNLLKFGLKQKMEKEMNVCLVRTICESNQKQIAFAFDQIFSLAMHLTGMESRIEHSPYSTYYHIGRKMINEKNICKLIPKCKDDDEDDDKSLTKMKLNLLEKIEKAKKLNNLLSRKESNQPDYQKPFRIIRNARKLRFAKRLFNKSFKKFDRLGRRMSKLLF